MASAQDYGARYQVIKQGGPFELVQVPRPVPQKDEVVIKVKAAALNPVDNKMLHLGVVVSSWPKTLGLEGSGIIDSVGSDVTNFAPGDEVLAALFDASMRGNQAAAFQEYAVVPAIHVAKKPAHLSWAEAASLPIGFLTAAASIGLGLGIRSPFLEGTDDGGGFKPQAILVLGGSSAAGAATVQMLRLMSADVMILATSSTKHHKRVISLGAEKVFDYRAGDVVERIRAATPSGKGVEAIIDAVNGVADNNSFLDLLTGSKKLAEVRTGLNLKEIPEGVERNLVLGETIFMAQGGQNLFASLERLLEEKRYKLPVEVKVVGHGLESVGRGLDELKKGVSGSKLVIAY